MILVHNEQELTGYAEGSIASAARPQLVATAALDAIRQGLPAAEAIHISSAEISRIGSNRVAVVTVVYVDPPTELVVSGSAVVRRDRDDAVGARAARCHQPSSRAVSSAETPRSDPHCRAIRASLSTRAPRRSPTLVPARRRRRRRGRGAQVGVGAPRARFRRASRRGRARRRAPPRRHVATVPRHRPGRRPSARTRRARGHHRRCRPGRGGEPLLAADQSGRSGDDGRRPRGARRPRRVPPSRSPVAARRVADAARHPAAPAELAPRHDQRPLARAAREPRLRRGHAAEHVRPRSAAGRSRRAPAPTSASRPTTWCCCNRLAPFPGRTSRPRSRSRPSWRGESRHSDSASGSPDPRRTGTTACSRSSSTALTSPWWSGGRRASPTPTPPPTSCSSRRPGRASATR